MEAHRKRVPILDGKRETSSATPLPHAKDREMMHKAVGWLPQAKGSSININTFGGRRRSQTDDDGRRRRAYDGRRVRI